MKRIKKVVIILAILVVLVVLVGVLVLKINQEYPNDWNSKNLNKDNPYVKEIINGKECYAPIPKGFEVKEGTISTGLVIEDEKNNEYVWVPVDDTYMIRQTLETAEEIAKNYWEARKVGIGEAGVYRNEPYPRVDGSWTKVQWDAMYESVMKYEGFYIGRYETGKSETGEAIVKPNAEVWNYIQWNKRLGNEEEPTEGTAAYVANNMYNVNDKEHGAVSTLIYGIQWDTAINWAECESKSRTEDTYISKELPTKTASTYADDVTYDINKGIYDLVGNMCEWTMEGYKKESRFIRGGAYDVYEPSIARPYAFVTQQVCPCLGFRIALYVE